MQNDWSHRIKGPLRSGYFSSAYTSEAPPLCTQNKEATGALALLKANKKFQGGRVVPSVSRRQGRNGATWGSESSRCNPGNCEAINITRCGRYNSGADNYRDGSVGIKSDWGECWRKMNESHTVFVGQECKQTVSESNANTRKKLLPFSNLTIKNHIKL